jgi:phospholipase A1
MTAEIHITERPPQCVTALLLLASFASSCAHPEIQPASIEILQNREYSTTERSYVLSAHNPSYFLTTYNSKFDPEIYAPLGDEAILNGQKEEVKFQLSMKFPVWQNVFNDSSDLYLGYTQVSFWQIFSDSEALSRPFRETNYQPELFLRNYMKTPLPFGGELKGLDVGINHQSNGQTLELSRSWNRLMVRAAADYGNLAFLGRAWYRLPESDEDDENPNEYRYLGYGDLRAIWNEDGGHTISAMVRPSTLSAAVELTWSYPIADQLRVYLQWYNGYAENLFEYDRRTNRFGIGIAVTDWLIGD